MTPSELQNLPPYTGYTRHTKEIALVCQVFHSIVNDQVSHIAYFISLINFVTYQPRFFHQLLITQLSSVTFLTSHITHFISLCVTYQSRFFSPALFTQLSIFNCVTYQSRLNVLPFAKLGGTETEPT